MKIQIAFFVVTLFILTACAAQIPAPSATLPPAPTATLTPAPTFTPTPTISPAITDMQEQIAGTAQNLTLNTEGKLEYKGVTYDGLNYGEDGNWHLTLVDGTEVTLAPDQVSMDDENGFSPNGYTYDAAKGWSVEVIKDYPICSIPEFQKCEFPEADFFDGSFQKWHETMARPFIEGQVDLRPWTQEPGSRGLLFQDITIKRARGAVSVWVDPAEGITVYPEKIENRIIPFQLPDPSHPYDPEMNIFVTGVGYLYNPYKDSIGVGRQGGIVIQQSDWLENKTNQLLIVPGFTYPNTGLEIPLVKKTWETLGAEKMQSIMDRVAAGDPTALRELNGMPILLLVVDTTDW